VKKSVKGEAGSINVSVTKDAKKFFGDSRNYTNSAILENESEFISILYGKNYVLKVYRRIEEGVHPAVESLKFLTEETPFVNIPEYSGNLFYRTGVKDVTTLGLFKTHIPSEGNAYKYFYEAGRNFMENAVHRQELPDEKKLLNSFFNSMTSQENYESSILCEISERIYVDMMDLFSKRTAEMHKSLASGDDNTVFKPEPFTLFYQRSIYQSLRTLIKNTTRSLNKTKSRYPEQADDINNLLMLEKDILDFTERLTKIKVRAKKIRIHGNFNLNQILFTGKDFIIANFEGMPDTGLSDRRLKRFVLRDVASVIVSVHNIAYKNLFDLYSLSNENREKLEVYAEQWWLCMSSAYLHSYFSEVSGTGVIPDDEEMLKYLTILYITEKFFTELYTGLQKETSIEIPLRGLVRLSTNYLKGEK
jgi:maltose alpha-D-glucosyltransferase / alpha-amylase